MKYFFVVLAALLALGLGAVVLSLHRRACAAEAALAELRASAAASGAPAAASTNGVARKSVGAPHKAAPDVAPPGPLEASDIEYAEDELRITFANVGKERLIAPPANALGISPALETSFRVDGNMVYVEGKFKPDTFYTATFSKDWATTDGRTLGREIKLSVRTPRPEPELNLLSTGFYYPVKGRGTLRFPIETRMVTNLNVAISRAFACNLNQYDLESWDGMSRMEDVAQKTIRLSAPYDARSARMLELDNVLTNRLPGVYRVRIKTDAQRRNWWGGREHLEEVFHFALTDLGIQATFDEHAGRMAFAAVNRLSDGRPVVGCEVTFLSRKNRIVATGITREDGSVLVSFDPSYDSKQDRVTGVFAKTADDVAYLKMDDDSARVRNAQDGSFGKARAFVFAERDLCRPGESFDSAVFARGPAKLGGAVLGGAVLDLELHDREGTKVATQRVTCDRFGFASAKWPIPANAATGQWRVVCRLGEDEIGELPMRVAAFVADRFRLDLTTPAPSWVGLDRSIPFVGGAKYYFGEPVDEADWRFAGRLLKGRAPKHWKGWTVGAETEDNGVKFTCSGTVSNGQFRVIYPGVAAQGIAQAFAPVGLMAEVSVTEPGGRAVSTTRYLTAFPTDRFLGVKDGEAAAGEARAFDLALLPALADGVVINETENEIALTFEKVAWSSHYVREGTRYKVEWRETRHVMPTLARKVPLPIGANAATWRGRIAFDRTSMPAGRYILTAKLGDKLKTTYDFWHWAGEVGERSTSPAALEIRADADSYAPGDIATLTFAAPCTGHVYVVSGSGMLMRGVSAPVVPGENTVRVPVPGTALGCHYAALTFVAEQHAAAPRRLSGLARLAIDATASRRLDVTIQAPTTARPLGETELAVTLKDKAGHPRAGRVRLAATDAGVLALTAFRTPDPHAYFFAHDFGVPFSAHDLYSSIYPDLRILPNGKIGGGADECAMISFNRRDSNAKQKETARVVLPPVEVPASGTAHVKVKLPDFTGALRFMAVATDEKAVGAGDTEMTVRQPATALLSAPRFVTAGDTFMLTAQVFNHDLPEGEWHLVLALPEGFAVDGRASAACKGVLAKGGSEVVPFKVVVAQTAPLTAARLPVTLTLGGEKIVTETFVTVRPRVPAETRVTYLMATNGLPTLPPVEEEWIKAERVVDRAPSPTLAIRDSLAWLRAYPYGCLEQTCAAAFPFLVADDLLALKLISEAERAMARQRLEVAHGAVMQMRLSDGGFAMWPRGDTVWTEGSLFACHFLFEAEKGGHIQLDGGRRRELLDWLAEVANDARDSNRENRAYAAYSLAVAKDERFLNPARNITRLDKPDWATYLAASALVRGGYAAEGLAARDAAMAAKAWESENEPVRRMGMALFISAHSGLAEDGSALLPLVSRLYAKLRGDGSAWGTTQENAWAAAGLASFLNGVKWPDAAEFVRIATTGVPRKAFPKPSPIALTRRYLNEAGQPIASAKRGELVTVEIVFETPAKVENAVLADLLPGGLELEDSTFETRSKIYAADEDAEDTAAFVRPVGQAELRDDRWLWFGVLWKQPNNRKYRLAYRARAVTPGVYAVPGITIEDMYNPDFRGGAEGDGVFRVE